MTPTRDTSTVGTDGQGAGPPPAGTGAHLTFNIPMSVARATALVAELAGSQPRTVLDVGCGWAELLLQVVQAVPEAHGTGVDVHGPDIERGHRAAAQRGLGARVDLRHGPAGDDLGAADLVLNLGSFHAFGSTEQALRALRGLVRPGGRVLFGAEFWQRLPTPEQLEAMWEGASLDDCTDLGGLVEQAVTAGFRPVRVATATTAEWEDYESGHLADREEWLATNADHPEAPAVRQTLDEAWAGWLRGHREVLGFAYLTLLPV